MHVILELAKKYPQILIPVQKGARETEEYQNVVLRGMECNNIPDFTYSDKDTLEVIDTPAGPAEVITLYNRKDFEHMMDCLGNRCQPGTYPESMGASTIIGLNNWIKVRAGEENYKDAIIVLSSGIYSHVTVKDVKKATNGRIDLSEEKWLEKSVTIRKYHELKHFEDRKLRPDDVDPLRDEIYADRNGIIAAFGYYDKDLAKLFLGLEGESYRKGGRLENYLGENDTLEEFIQRSLSLIEE